MKINKKGLKYFMSIICGRTDCMHNCSGATCELKHIAIARDLTCQHFALTSDKEFIALEEKSQKIMNALKLDSNMASSCENDIADHDIENNSTIIQTQSHSVE